jgi:subtilisin family serine protease
MDSYLSDQKIEPSLRAALAATPEELSQSGDLATGTNTNGLWEVILLYSGTPEALQLAFPDTAITFLLGNYAILHLPKDEIAALAASPLVIYVERPRRLFFEVLSGKRFSCITGLQENTATALTGKGVLLSIIDSGIDYMHPDFRNADGSTRILALWDQSIAPDVSAGRTSPPGYSLGTLYTQAQINEAIRASTPQEQYELCSSTDSSGHGTHVTGIAAGNGRASDGIYRGVAYEASLLIIKLGSTDPKGFPTTTQLMQAVDFSVRYASSQKLPLTINLSFGNTYGSHSGTSLLETYLDSVANLWQNCIVVGSGNEGNSGGHAGGTIASEESRKIEFSIGEYEQTLSLQIWKNYWDDIRFALLPPGTATPLSIPDQPGSWRFATKDTQILVYYGEPSPYSINQEIYIDLLPEKNYIRSGIWAIRLSSQMVTGGAYDLWMPALAARGSATQFLTPTPEITLTIPSTASKVITVGAYDAYTNTAAGFSGRGYTWNTNQIKPDIIAPGVDITSCAVGGGYEIRSGTSMATPFVSGSCALLMQWGIIEAHDPFLYGEKMKASLIRGARRLPLASRYPNPQTGWGALCVANSIPGV